MSTKKASNALASQYKKYTDIEHILEAPDTYLSSVEEDGVNAWTFDHTTKSLVFRNYRWVPALYKLFDEALVNCRDHFIRIQQRIAGGDANAHPVTQISVTIDQKTGVITMLNDGNGIDIAKHPEHKVYIPQMIFGELRTSTNYDKEKKKIVGGKNGFGIKLVFIYSKWATIETVDHTRKLKYIQRFENNLGVTKKPSVKKSTSNPYTKVSFLPDYARFGVDGLTDDMVALFSKRVYDVAAITDRSVKVRLNKTLLPVRNFEQYVSLCIGPKSECTRIYERAGERWEYAVCLSPQDEFTQISFVNGVYTGKGGKHVEYILNQLVRGIVQFIEKKKKVKVKPATIKEQLMLFVNCSIENPAFDSQVKDCLTTPSSKFGSKCSVSQKTIASVAKLGVMEAAMALTEIKDAKALKKSDGRKVRKLRGVPKLVDANWAGGAQSHKCILLLAEGDSAKAGILSGLSKEDRNRFGVFPLKGKLMNAKDASLKKLSENAEIANIKKIVGLETDKKYENLKEAQKSLRYGQVIFMTDQDLDGAHIKGLCINLFHSQWHDLVTLNKFLGFINTPILKAKKGVTELSFYNEAEYIAWKSQNNDGKGWRVKYYKGLGTSTAREFKEYFAQVKIVHFKYGGQSCDAAIDGVFNKRLADQRKVWLGNYDKDAVLDTSESEVSYKDFVDREMKHFSKYDCERSIPNLMDGLKTSLRKIIYCAFKRNLVKEIKVAQLAGYVSEHGCYHHGEMSLVGGIKHLAWEFVGSNNIALLQPNGQFGTRRQGGKDSASERYIYTQLNPLTKFLFPSVDFPVLEQLEDDGTLIEPEYYAPVIPMVLVNGGKGIGTGFSSEVLCYSVTDIVANIRSRLAGAQSHPDINPYYEGFKGAITAAGPQKFLIRGCYKLTSVDVIHITELPVGVWTEDYIKFLDGLSDGKNPIVKSYTDMSTDTEVDFTVKLTPGTTSRLFPKKLDYGVNGLEKALRLVTTRTTTNMHLFNSQQRLRKYVDIHDIVDAYFDVRFALYGARKEYQIANLEKDVMVLSNKARFIKEQCDQPATLDLRRKKKAEVLEMLEEHNYDTLDGDKDYAYLRKMSIESVEEENLLRLMRERDAKCLILEQLKDTTLEQMWSSDLTTFSEQYQKYRSARDSRQRGVVRKVKVKRARKKPALKK